VTVPCRPAIAAALAGILALAAVSGSCGGNDGAVTILMHDNYFEPAEVRLAAGETVTIAAKNRGRLIHNITVDETPFRSDIVVNAGKESRFDVTFTAPGTYHFQCDYHLPGMVGVFIVE
jgi:plastocyanin